MKRSKSGTVFPALLLIGGAGLVGCEATQSQEHAKTPVGQADYLNPSSAFAWKHEGLTEPAPMPRTVHAAPEPLETGQASWLALPTGNRETSTILVEKFARREVVAGQPFDYDIKVTNLTGGTLSNVMVTDSLPPEFSLKSSDPKPQASGGPSGLTAWVLGTLDPHEARTIHLTGAGTAAGMITSCASATYAQALCSAINVVQPALRLTKVAPEQALLCDPFEVKLTVANAGTGTARNIQISDRLPAGLKTADGKSEVEFTVPLLASGESKQFAFRAKADHPGLFVNGAMAAGDGGLKAEASEVTTRVTQPVLIVTSKGPEKMFLGRPVTYELTVTNTGDATAAQTVLEDPLPAGSTLVSATDGGALSDGMVRWAIGALEPKAVRTVKVTMNFASIGDFRNTATARAICASPATAAASLAMEGVPALMLNGFDDPDPVEVGGNVVYTLNITNQGSAPLTNVKLVCRMEDGDSMSFVTATGPTMGTPSGAVISFPVVAELDPKGVVVYKVTVRAEKAGQVQFRAEATSDQITRPLVKIETTHFYK